MGVLIAPPVTLKFDGSNQGEAKAIKAELIDQDTIKVEFNQPIHSASPQMTLAYQIEEYMM